MSSDAGSLPVISVLMTRLRSGDAEAARSLVDVFYEELRRMAVARMRKERAAHTWQPTALVNELYIELVKIRELKDDSDIRPGCDKAAFFGLAGHIMHRLLLSHARPLAFRSSHVEIDALSDAGRCEHELREVELVLSRLASLDPMLRTVVELKVFEGLTGEEIAERLGCSRRSIARYWKFAQSWLDQAMSVSAPRERPHRSA